jgi:hypothetical protein
VESVVLVWGSGRCVWVELALAEDSEDSWPGELEREVLQLGE